MTHSRQTRALIGTSSHELPLRKPASTLAKPAIHRPGLG